MLICKLLLLPCDMHYCILFILCLQTVPGEGEVHVKEEASEFIVSSCTILLFFYSENYNPAATVTFQNSEVIGSLLSFPEYFMHVDMLVFFFYVGEGTKGLGKQ